MSNQTRRFDWDEAALMRGQGLTYGAIAVACGVTVNAVRRALIPAERARRYAYRARWQRETRPHEGPCEDCGEPCSYGRYRTGSRCRACYAIHLAESVRPDTLRCIACREWLPDDDFTTKRTGTILRRGRDAECRGCQATRKRDQRATADPATRDRRLAADRERKRRQRVSA